MPPSMKEVYSSHVGKVGYDDETGDLYVEWSTGKTSVYHGVPPDVAEDVMGAYSVGSALAGLKGSYRHSYA